MVHCMTTSYSVLMSVYAKENANYLSAAIESMLCQSCPPTQFVLVCDGPLTPALDKVIIDFTAAHPDLFRILRLPENQGLGFALQEGLSACECQLVARMDSDDIALPLRMEHQLAAMVADPCLDVVGGQIAEFVGDPRNIQGYRMVPISPEEVRQRAVRRNPINHMTVLFRRDAVLAAGNYQDMKGFEDYFLWGRMLASGLPHSESAGDMRPGSCSWTPDAARRPGLFSPDGSVGAFSTGLWPDKCVGLL